MASNSRRQKHQEGPGGHDEVTVSDRQHGNVSGRSARRWAALHMPTETAAEAEEPESHWVYTTNGSKNMTPEQLSWITPLFEDVF